jgi:hypothetical protein
MAAWNGIQYVHHPPAGGFPRRVTRHGLAPQMDGRRGSHQLATTAAQQQQQQRKARENDGVQLGFLFAYEVFSLGLFFPCFPSFCRSGPPALRGEKKPKKRCPRALDTRHFVFLRLETDFGLSSPRHILPGHASSANRRGLIFMR